MTVTARATARALTVPPLLLAVRAAPVLSQKRHPNILKRMVSNLSCLLIVMAAMFAAGPASGIEGTATWDIELVREYIKKNQGVEMPAEPPAFPAQEKVAELNPEFAARMKALLAIYQAHGGAPQIGIMPDGGLRSRAKQMEIYAECRRIRQVLRQRGFREELAETLADIVPAGDGSQKEHWELVCSEQPPTQAWTSWHNLGLAVDLAYTNNDAYGRMVSAAGDLGMIWGGWFSGRPGGYGSFDALPDASLSPYLRHAAEVLGWDMGHFEWHPGQYDAEVFESQSGTALATSLLHTGYKWKLPDRIYRLLPSAGPNSPLTLFVYDLVQEDNWILLSKMRAITGDANQWHGNWYSFDPPMQLFPTYIPTVRFSRSTNDESPRRATRVTHQLHSHGLDSAGRLYKQYQTRDGYWNYDPSFTIRNWEIEAGIEIMRQDNIRKLEKLRTKKEPPLYSGYQGFRQFRVTSVYDVAIQIQARSVGNVTLDRRVDSNGYTSDDNPRQENGRGRIYLSMGWNRDHGKVGAALRTLSTHGIALAEIEGDETISASLPSGAFDRESPPTPPPANPRPQRQYPPYQGRP